jgi:membrane-associated phospholipid phosphatase
MHNRWMRSYVRLVVFCLATVAPWPAWAQSVDNPPQQPPTETIPSFRSLFTELPGDFANLMRPETAIILGVGAGTSAGVHPVDARLTRNAVSARTLEELLDSGQVIGGAYFQIGGAVATYVVGRLSHSRRVATVGAELVRAQLVNAALTEGLKETTRRRRPDGSKLSFPSGHSSATFATAAVVQREFGWKVGVPAYALASYVAISRLSENKHYASDVVFGAAIGIVSARAIRFHRSQHDLAVSPLAVPGGAGVSVAWVPKIQAAR